MFFTHEPSHDKEGKKNLVSKNNKNPTAAFRLSNEEQEKK